jgi:purine-nucleoside phosphorylase
MLVTDHINLTTENPLVGLEDSFVDMTNAYDPVLLQDARAAARHEDVELSEGVYAAVRGPSYETKAEIRMLRAMGADAVGMSTVLETIALRRAGVRVGAVSCITNLAAGLSEGALSHEEVTETAARVEVSFGKLMIRWIALADAGNNAGRQQ